MRFRSNSALLFILLGTLAALVSSCDNLEKKAREVSKSLSAQFDSAVSAKARSQVLDDFLALIRMSVEANDESYFSRIFGGRGTEDVLRYVNVRVKYILPSSASLESRAEVTEQVPDLTQRLSFNTLVDLSAGGIAQQATGEPEVFTLATNLGTPAWFIAQFLPEGQKLGVRISDSIIPVESSRVGIIQLGAGYLKLDDNGKPLIPRFDRITTWIHEARHSDCTGGLWPSDVARMKNGLMPLHPECGHLHALCPAGHPLAGQPACDATPWGAYSVEAIYASVASEKCTNCTDEDKAAALATAVDSLSRVLVLEDMLNGKFGDPDMSSEGLLSPDDPRLHPKTTRTRAR